MKSVGTHTLKKRVCIPHLFMSVLIPKSMSRISYGKGYLVSIALILICVLSAYLLSHVHVAVDGSVQVSQIF